MLQGQSVFILYFVNFGYAFAVAALAYVLRGRIIALWSKVTSASQGDGIAGTYSREMVTTGLIGGFGVLFALAMIGVNAGAAMVGGVATGLFLPRFVNERRRAKYVEDFDSSLIESLTTMSASLKAGLTLRDSLGVTARNCPKAFADQAAEILKEYKFGIPLEEALDNVRERVRTPNANIAFGAMTIGTQLGGNLPAVLQRIVSTVRERQRVEGKLRSLTAQGRMQAILLCSAPPALGVGMYLWDPQKMALLTETIPGQVLLCLAIALEVIGIFATRKIMQLDV